MKILFFSLVLLLVKCQNYDDEYYYEEPLTVGEYESHGTTPTKVYSGKDLHTTYYTTEELYVPPTWTSETYDGYRTHPSETSTTEGIIDVLSEERKTEDLTDVQCTSDKSVHNFYENGKLSCYKFWYCSTAGAEPITISCPTGTEWLEDTIKCVPATESCRVERMKTDHTPTWLSYELQCPSTASLLSREQSIIHKYLYYRMMNMSASKQLNRHIDYFTPIVLEQGIYRHVMESCNGFFKCIYKEQGPVHVFKEAVLLFCKEGQVFNNDWHWCVNRNGYLAGYRSTHPDPYLRAFCIPV